MLHLFLNSFIIILLFWTYAVENEEDFEKTSLPLWSWECLSEKCVPTQAKSNEKLQSLATCNMLCTSVNLWPQPTGPSSLSSTAVPVRAELFQVRIASAPSSLVHEYLKEAFKLFREDLHLLEHGSPDFAEWRAVAVKLAVHKDGDVRLKLDTDESYKLFLQPKQNTNSALSVDIHANSFVGVVRGLETLMQLVWYDPYIGSLLLLDGAIIHDSPKFRYRGIMLDTARNYFPLSDLLRTIDAMAACKLNTFHWHITDSQTFPLVLASTLELIKHTNPNPRKVYSYRDIEELVKRARLRGIRILIEVDTPAHVGHAWKFLESAKSEKVVYCLDDEIWSRYCPEPPCGHLNPKNPEIYDFLENVYSDIIRLTGVDDIFHIGGDDVSFKCWLKNSDSKPVKIWVQYTKKLLQRLQAANRKLPNVTLMWNSRLEDYFKTDLTDYLHVLGLQNRETGILGSTHGIRTVVSHEHKWNLNNGLGNWNVKADVTPYNSWQRIYEHRPWKSGMMGWILGGEATVWSSMLTYGELDAHVWPRAAALAERLWSDTAEAATRHVQARLDVHRSRLLARGINATPLWSMWCTHYVSTCG